MALLNDVKMVSILYGLKRFKKTLWKRYIMFLKRFGFVF